MTLLERILDARMRNTDSEIRENQIGFRKGRGIVDGLFVIRHIVENRREFT